MEASSTLTRSDSRLKSPSWQIAFVGGNADLDLSDTSQDVLALRDQGNRSLARSSVGDRIWVVRLQGGHQMISRLVNLGIGPGVELKIVSQTQSGSVVVELPGCRVGIGAGIAHRIIVATKPSTELLHSKGRQRKRQHRCCQTPNLLGPQSLGALRVGQSGRIVRYEQGCRAYRSKLLSMGLTPGTRFTVTRQAPLGDPIEIEVRGFKLSLRKGEAAALQVERLDG